MSAVDPKRTLAAYFPSLPCSLHSFTIGNISAAHLFNHQTIKFATFASLCPVEQCDCWAIYPVPHHGFCAADGVFVQELVIVQSPPSQWNMAHSFTALSAMARVEIAGEPRYCCPRLPFLIADGFHHNCADECPDRAHYGSAAMKWVTLGSPAKWKRRTTSSCKRSAFVTRSCWRRCSIQDATTNVSTKRPCSAMSSYTPHR